MERSTKPSPRNALPLMGPHSQWRLLIVAAAFLSFQASGCSSAPEAEGADLTQLCSFLIWHWVLSESWIDGQMARCRVTLQLGMNYTREETKETLWYYFRLYSLSLYNRCPFKLGRAKRKKKKEFPYHIYIWSTYILHGIFYILMK